MKQMSRFAIVTLLLSLCAKPLCAQIVNGSKWHNGKTWFLATTNGNEAVFVEEGDETKGQFIIETDTVNNTQVLRHVFGKDFPIVGKEFDTVILKRQEEDNERNLQEGKVMAIRSEEGILQTTLSEFANDFKQIRESLAIERIAGEYETDGGKMAYIDRRGKLKMPQDSTEKGFCIWTEEPSNDIWIETEDGWCLRCEREEEKLRIWGNEETATCNGIRLMADLRMTDNGYCKCMPGLYPVASTRHLTFGELGMYSQKELRTMRDEIMARHGHMFANPETSQEYEQKDWYVKLAKQGPTPMSEMEKQNKEMIETVLLPWFKK